MSKESRFEKSLNLLHYFTHIINTVHIILVHSYYITQCVLELIAILVRCMIVIIEFDIGTDNKV